MNLPNRRKLGAVALIVAGIGAFLVPFLLHAPTPQGTPTSPGKDTTKTTTTPTNHNGDCTTNCGSDTPSTGTCNEDKATDPQHSNRADQKGIQTESQSGDQTDKQTDNQDDKQSADHANGQKAQHSIGESIKHDIDTGVAFMKAMGSHTPVLEKTHSTETDNHTVHGHDVGPDTTDGPDSQDSSCADTEQEQDD